MDIRKFISLCVILPAVSVFLGGVIAYNLASEKTPQHTSTVSGSSGELKCNSSCVIDNK